MLVYIFVAYIFLLIGGILDLLRSVFQVFKRTTIKTSSSNFVLPNLFANVDQKIAPTQ